MFGPGIHLELVHVGEELGVVARFLEIRNEQLHGFNRRERREVVEQSRSRPAEFPGRLQRK
jgi:hypothetical protein